MKKLLFGIFLFCTVVLGQSAQRSSIATLPSASGVQNVIPNASVYVCAFNLQNTCTGSYVSVYSDAALTSSLAMPIHADAYGNYNYYVANGTQVIEKICTPYMQCSSVPLTIGTFGSSGTGTITGVNASTGLSGGGNTGTVTLAVNPAVIPFLGSANTFTQNQTAPEFIGSFLGNLTGNGSGIWTGSVVGASSLNVLKAGDTMTGPLVVPVLNTLQYATSFSTLQSDVTACASANCTIAVNSTIAVTSNYTVPSYVTLRISNGAQLQPAIGITLTVNTCPQAAAVQIFGGAGTVSLNCPQVPFEWFGAVGGTSLPSTDSTTAMNACLSSITNGQCILQALTYKITSALSITKSNVGIRGVSTGLPSPTLYPNPSPSQIETTSSTADIVDVAGTNSSNTVAFNNFQDFTLSRSVNPTGSARGLSFIFVDGAIVEGVTSQDSLACFYIHGMASQGVGRIENSVAIWGYNGFSETSGSLAGFFIDSQSGVTNNSLRLRNDGIFSAIGHSNSAAWTTYGIELAGTATHDLHAIHVETAEVDYGDWIFQSGSSFPASADIFITEPINDGCFISCVFIQSVQGSVSVSGGWNFANGTSPVIDIESSSHVIITGAKVTMGSAVAGAILVNSSGGVQIIGDDIIPFGGSGGYAISFTGTGHSVISHNVINGPYTWGTSIISLTAASSYNVVANNTISGTATNGIFVDTTSLHISGVETNSIGDSAIGTITTPLNDSVSNAATVVLGQLMLPYAAASSGTNCVQVDVFGNINKSGSPCSGGSTANIQITTGTTLIAANTCTSSTATSMSGVTTTSAIIPPTPTTDTSAVTGWGSTGGLSFTYFPTTNTFNWRVCNTTGLPITPGGSVTWNVGAH